MNLNGGYNRKYKSQLFHLKSLPLKVHVSRLPKFIEFLIGSEQFEAGDMWGSYESISLRNIGEV